MTPVAVRDLASFVFRHGDLYPSGESRSVEAWEGTMAHSAIQKQREAGDAHYRKEVSLKLPIVLLGEERQLQGRVDGITQNASGQTVIEEYKTSRHPRSVLRGADEAQPGGCIHQADHSQSTEGALQHIGDIASEGPHEQCTHNDEGIEALPRILEVVVRQQRNTLEPDLEHEDADEDDVLIHQQIAPPPRLP